jgi:flavin reductase (DIM6/NTAB) family NADH-FMN oxidoreductase RutF
MNFSQRDFRDALGLFPTGVAVVTSTSPHGYELGITVNSFVSVSLDPPLVSFNIGRSLKCFDELMGCKSFAIHILRHDQTGVSLGFGRPNDEKWREIEWKVGVTGSPIFLPHLAVFECERYADCEAGDHVIIVSRVVHFEVNVEDSALIFYRGAYHRVGEILHNKRKAEAGECSYRTGAG